jgi:very-short-patch-repair endonuclease
VTPDERAARIARGQRGRVTAAQLRAAGLTDREIRGRRERGVLVAEHRGVFAYASAPPVAFAREQSALLACGPEATLSHRAAGAVRGIVALAGVVDVTMPPGRRRRRRGVVLHQRPLERHEWVVVDGLRATTPLRTLHDLAEVLPVPALRRAIAEAYARGLVEPGVLRPQPGRRGAPALAAALAEAPRMTRSAAERAFLRLVREAGLPLPDTNVQLAGFEVDAFWPRQRVAVEIDVFGTHAGRCAFDRDRRKDVALRAHGVTPLRFTDTMLADTPMTVVGDLFRALHF